DGGVKSSKGSRDAHVSLSYFSVASRCRDHFSVRRIEELRRPRVSLDVPNPLGTMLPQGAAAVAPTPLQQQVQALPPRSSGLRAVRPSQIARSARSGRGVAESTPGSVSRGRRLGVTVTCPSHTSPPCPAVALTFLRAG